MSLRKGKSPTNDTVSKSSSDDDKKTENAKLAQAISDRKEVSYADMVEGAKNLASYVVLPTSAHVAGLLAYASLFFTIAAGQGSLNNSENKQVINKLIYASIMMLTLPFIAYFSFYYLDVWFPLFKLDDSVRSTVGGVAAVSVIQIIIITYTLMGILEKDERNTK